MATTGSERGLTLRSPGRFLATAARLVELYRETEVTDPPPAEGRVRLCTQYRLVEQTALASYLRDHAPRLRAEGIARFGGRFRASRRVLAGLSLPGH